MLFPYFVYIMHLTKFTCGSSLLMKRPLVMEGKHWLKKNKKKKEKQVQRRKTVYHSVTTIKITLWKPLVLAELHAGNHTRFPFLYASTSLDTKILKIVILLLSTFCSFPIFAEGFAFAFAFAFGNFAHNCVLLCNASLSN